MIDIRLALLPLDCPTCGAPIAAHGQDVVYYCSACRNGYLFGADGDELRPIKASFVAAPHLQAQEYKPFWLLPAEITVHERQAKGGGFSGLLRFFLGDEGPSGASSEGTFAVPAFQAPLAAITLLTRRYTEAQPQLGERLGERLLGGCYGVEDARKLAHYALIVSEVDKPDTLRDLRYEIDFGPPRLLGVPFVRAGEAVLEDAFFRIRV
jgi:hypothetical protein